MISRALMIFAVTLFFAPLAQAQETGLPHDRACTSAYNGCSAACERQHGSDQAGYTGCAARCAAEQAACDATAGYEAAKPWAKEQIDKVWRFIEGFMGPDAPPSTRQPRNQPDFERRENDDEHDSERT